MVEGIENAPEALLKLFSGQNTGKLLVKVSGEP
jgi:NADPH-dependent curcumin reductase CurA